MTIEYDAYHKLSLASIDINDPLPQIVNTDALINETIQNIIGKVGNSWDPIFASLSESDRSYLQKRLS